MSWKQPYSVDADFPNQKVNPTSLKNEILASSIQTEFEYIFVKGDACDIYFVSEITAEELTTLNGVVAAHQGNPPVSFKMHASSSVINGVREVTSDTEWQEAGGVVTNLAFFVPDVSKAWGRLSGEVRVSGSGAKLRIIRNSDDAVCTPADVELSDTGGEWVVVSFWANQNQPEIPDRFELQGKLDGAVSLEVRDYSISLLELLN